MQLAILARDTGGRVDGITEFALRLAEALRAEGTFAVDLWLRMEAGSWRRANMDERGSPEVAPSVPLADYDAAVVQYNPFMYGRWGFAPGLPLMLARRRPQTLALMVHEPYVPLSDWRSAVMGGWQRAQLLALRLECDVVFTSIEAWAARFARGRPRRPTFHLPVGSNLPDKRDARQAERARLGLADDTLVLAAFGTGHPSALTRYVVAAANEVAAEDIQLTLLNLGAGAPPLHGLDSRIAVHQPGWQPPDELARLLGAADVFLAPFVDGVSTRRSTVMAALQHGLAVLGTDGPLTDGLLRRAPDALVLVPVARPDVFSRAAARLACSVDGRRSLAERGRALYEQTFDWPVLASRVSAALAGSRRR
jgi:glycosyltransferase involved in cell wall biosynthesis